MRAAFAKCFFLKPTQVCLGVHYDKLEGCVGWLNCRTFNCLIPLLGTYLILKDPIQVRVLPTLIHSDTFIK